MLPLGQGYGKKTILGSMHAFGTIFVDAIVGMFFAGMAGSAIVILIAFVEDFKELFGGDEGPESPATAVAGQSKGA